MAGIFTNLWLHISQVNKWKIFIVSKLSKPLTETRERDLFKRQFKLQHDSGGAILSVPNLVLIYIVIIYTIPRECNDLLILLR